MMKQKINSHLEKEKIICSCGCDMFTSAANVVKIVQPIIGAPKALYPVPQTAQLFCLQCRTKLVPNNANSRKEEPCATIGS